MLARQHPTKKLCQADGQGALTCCVLCYPALCCVVFQVTNPRWSAPEVLRNSVVSLHSDVFSFAVVMWELLTWQQPYEDMMSVQVG